MAPKLSKLLIEHDSAQITGDLVDSFTPEVKTDAPMEGFLIPEDASEMSVPELQDEVGARYLEACLKMAHRAMTGQVNVFKEGDLPHKMALMLAHKMMPSRKVGEKRPDDSPKQNKQVARALKSLIKSLTIDAEVESDGIHKPDGVEISTVNGQRTGTG